MVSEKEKRRREKIKLHHPRFWLGKKRSKEDKEKMSQAKLGKYKGESNPFFGKKHSLETRQKISEALKGHKAPNPFKKGHIPWNKGLKGLMKDKEDKILLDAFFEAHTILTGTQKENAKFLANVLFELETQHGCPAEVVLQKMNQSDNLRPIIENMSRIEKYKMFQTFQEYITEHKLKSGMPFDGKRHHKLQELNRRHLLKFLKTGEFETL